METPDEVEVQLYKWLDEAVELRYGAGKDPDGPLRTPALELGPGPFLQVLLRARQRQDRIEELMGKAHRVRAKLAIRQMDASQEAQEALDRATVERANKRQEYEAFAERKAGASLDSFAEKRAAHAAKRRLAVAEEVHKAISDIHWGLNGYRTDIRQVIQSFQLEDNLTR